MKHGVPKGDKKRKKQVALDIAKLEAELHEKHAHEIKEVNKFQYVRKIFGKTNISYPLIRTRTLGNVSFSENFVYMLNKWSLSLLHLPWFTDVTEFISSIVGIFMKLFLSFLQSLYLTLSFL